MKTLFVFFAVLIQSFVSKGFVYPDQLITFDNGSIKDINNLTTTETTLDDNTFLDNFQINNDTNEIKNDNETEIDKHMVTIQNRFNSSESDLDNHLTKDCGNVRPTWRGEAIIRRSELAEFPFYVDLIYENNANLAMHCGGTLINDRFVLTAASCIKSKPNIIGVRLGEHDLVTNPDCYPVIKHRKICAPPTIDLKIDNKDIIVHNLYRSNSTNSRKYDIALIRLPKSVNFTNSVEPVCLPIKENYRKLGNLTIIGFPQIDILGTRRNILSSLTIPYITNESCQNLLNKSIRKNYFCAGGEIQDNQCQGYGGNGLFYVVLEDYRLRWVLASVASYGRNICSDRNYLPQIFPKVEMYNDWILENIKYF